MASELSALQQAAAATGELQYSPWNLQPSKMQHASSHVRRLCNTLRCIRSRQLRHSAPRSRSTRRRCALHW